MKFTTRKKDTVTICEIEGEINFDSSPKLRKDCLELIEEGQKQLILDFKNITYIDSSGLATLVELLQRVKEVDGSLKLCGFSERVRGVFELTKLDTVFSIFEDTQKALSS